MFGKRKRDRLPEGEWEGSDPELNETRRFRTNPDELQGESPEAGFTWNKTADGYPEEDIPEEEYPEEYTDGDYTGDDEAGDGPEEKEEPRSILRPENRKPNFVVSVALNTVRTLIVALVLVGIAGLGALVGIAKGYVDTAPELDLAALDSQAQTSFIYDKNGT